jgi:magnesium chelatase subunit I
MSDFIGVIPAITGKVELVYEGEQEGPGIVAQNLIGKAIRTQFIEHFPNPEKFRKQKEASPYNEIAAWFGEGNTLDLYHDMPQAAVDEALEKVPGLTSLIENIYKNESLQSKKFFKEFALHGLAECSIISKQNLSTGLQFKDLLSGMFTLPSSEDDEYDIEDDDFRKR